MKKRKLPVLPVVVAVMIFLPFVAPAGGQREAGTATSAEPITVSYMDHEDRFNLAPRVKAMFEEKYPNIKLEYIKTPAGGADRVHDKQVTIIPGVPLERMLQKRFRSGLRPGRDIPECIRQTIRKLASCNCLDFIEFLVGTHSVSPMTTR